MRSAILTGQYVKIEQPTASPGDRMVAQLIDWVLQVAYLTLAVTQFRGLSPENFILLVILPIIAYPLLAEVLGQGQTIGKWVRGIRVVMADGSTPTLSAYLLRWLLIIVDGPMMSYLGILVIALTQRHQRIGDMAAGTVVVRLGTWKKLKVSLDEFQQFDPSYRPRYAAAADLTLEQANVIARALLSPGDERIAQLSHKVQQLLGVTPQESHDFDFLTRLHRDYQYYALETV